MGDDEAGGAPVASKAGAGPAKALKDSGDAIANHQAWGHLEGTQNWRIESMDDNPGVFLINFIIIHAVGNLHVFKGPDDFNGYGYFYVRLYWTGFGLPANIVEEYILLSVLLHVFVGLKRTWDMKLGLGIKSGHLNLAITGLALLTFMTIHLFQFRFGDTEQFGPYMVRPPPYLINFYGILNLDLFWSYDTSVEAVGVRDIYALEFKIFSNPL